MAKWLHTRTRVPGEDHRVSTFELLFDLVFVFAFTQVTTFIVDSHDALGVLRAMVILGILWISWVSFGWLSNQTHVDEGIIRIGMSAAMCAVFVLALAIPESFHDRPGGVFAPVVVGIAYFIVRLLHGVLYLIAAGDDRALRRQVYRTSASMWISVALIITGAFLAPFWQTVFWIAAFMIEVVFVWATSIGGDWRVNSASHWAERHGLVVILALGESVVAIGVGAAHEALGAPIIAGAALALTLAICLWWLYFDVTSIAAERSLAASTGVKRADLATSGYTYLHFLLIAGIVISAVGVELVMSVAGSASELGLFASCALGGGTSLYLFGHAMFWHRVGGTWKVWRLGGAVALLGLVPAGLIVAPLIELALVVVVAVIVVAAETTRYAERRAEIRGTVGDVTPR